MNNEFIIKGTTAENNTHIIYTTLFGYILTTKENYHSRISDTRKQTVFNDRDGFKDISDVVDYVEDNKWF